MAAADLSPPMTSGDQTHNQPCAASEDEELGYNKSLCGVDRGPDPPPASLGDLELPPLCDRLSVCSNRGPLSPAAASGDDVPPTPSAAGPTQSSSSKASSMASHPLECRGKLMWCVRLVRAQSLDGLPSPMPRCQDLSEGCFAWPDMSTRVFSVSHAWRNQVHPDPLGRQAQELQVILEEASRASPGVPVLVFLDFASIPQRPFAASQAPRTSEELTRFEAAVRCMHEMYFYSDHVVHLSWDEDGEVEGEGDETWVPASCLKGCSYLLMGGSVQVLPDGCEGAVGVRALDVVLAVDNTTVTSVEQLHVLLREGGTLVLLRRFPFGLPNSLHADQRGWIFLERFITMVKCAMVEEELAKGVVLTNSPTILAQITEGSARLRRAAQKNQAGKEAKELKEVLHTFLVELGEKQFSAASVDKQVDAAARASQGSSDRDVVMGIMKEFVDHLGQNWNNEARLQVRMAARVAAAATAAKEFMVSWPTFSDEYAARLEEASKVWRLWPLVKLILAIVPVAVLLVPIGAPPVGPVPPGGAGAFFLGQGVKYVVTCTAWSIVGNYLFFCGVRLRPRTLLGFFAHFILFNFAVDVVLRIVRLTGYNPVPLQFLFGAVSGFMVLPALWIFLPKEERRPEIWDKLVGGFFFWLFTVFVSGMGLPFISAALPLVSTGPRLLLLQVFLCAKILAEVLGTCLFPRLGPDTNRCLIFFTASLYEMNSFNSFLRIQDLSVVLVQACFNLLENGYHIMNLRRLNLNPREEQYLVASLVIREFVELLIPLQSLIVYLTFTRFRPENIVFICQQTQEDVERNAVLGLLLFSLNLLVTGFTFRWLSRRGHRPVSLLQGLLATSPFFFGLLSPTWGAFMAMNHSHWLSDYTLQFSWRNGGEWVCGVTWAPAA